VGLTNLGSESETCVGSRVRLVGVFISFEKNFYRLPFTPPSLVCRIGLSAVRVVSIAATASAAGPPVGPMVAASAVAATAARVTAAAAGAAVRDDLTIAVATL
jgi:hypothetical protein